MLSPHGIRAVAVFVLIAALAALGCLPAQASSHREAPFITTQPKVDGTDLYLFNSYEPARAGYVTLIANYQPFQDPYGGPNYFKMDPNALYEIHVDNNGDAREDLTFQFKFQNNLKATALNIGGQSIPIPLTQSGPVAAPDASTLNVSEQYTVTLVRGDRRTGVASPITRDGTGVAPPLFYKPVDNIGTKTITDYAAYAAQHVYAVDIPGCAFKGRVFVGQRRESFAVLLGELFDLFNAPLSVITNPAAINAGVNTLRSKNITTLALEVHKTCLLAPGSSDVVIGAWTTASIRQSQLINANPPQGHQTTASVGGAWVQVSRLGMPLVNELVIGLPDKDRFNASLPRNDAQFLNYVAYPTLPALVELAYATPGLAPSNFPRADLIATFLTGLPGVNQPAGVTPSDMIRLNTAIPAVPFSQQNRLGLLGNLLAGGSDQAGFPNGRRPKDDVVDITLVAAMGGLCFVNGNGNLLGLGAACNPTAVPLKETALKLNDAVDQAVRPLLPGFPYLDTPLAGAGGPTE